jgi:DNA repair protein RecN (Recombination protein N)
VEQRLDEIDALKRKHSVKDVADLLALQHDYEEKLATIEHNDERLSQLSASIAEQEKQAMATARELSNKRRKAAESFAAQLKDLSRELGLKNIAFEVQFTPIPLASTGIDAIQFMVAFNKNQALMPIKDTASGGELSRLMLCVKAIIASHMQLPTIIFDEVDTGVSGDTASMMGRMMRNIAHNIQVIAITHLPQVVAHGQHHFVVYKSDTAQATHTSVKALDAEQHLMEIARLLSGTNINQAAIDNARALIEAAQSTA